jgi:lysophospholipase L1-like esterase
MNIVNNEINGGLRLIANSTQNTNVQNNIFNIDNGASTVALETSKVLSFIDNKNIILEINNTNISTKLIAFKYSGLKSGLVFKVGGSVVDDSAEVRNRFFTVADIVYEGVPTSGTTGQVLIKSSDADYDTKWGSIGTVPIMPSETEQGTYYYKSGSGSTVTQKSDGTVDFSNDGTTFGTPFFEVAINPKCINTIKFDYTRISGELTDGVIYINKVGTGYIQVKSRITLPASTEYETELTPEWLAQNGLDSDSTIYIGLGTWSECSYNLGISNTYGIEDTALDLNFKVRKRSLEGKKAIFLGDSITALKDDNSWVEKFLDITGCLKVANVAVSSARLYDYEDTVYDGDPKASVQHNNTLGNQVQKIINNQYETPDLIIIAIGTNGGITADTTRISAVYYNNGSMPPLSDIDKTHSEGAFRYCTETLHNLYPNATIFWCNPIQAAINSREIGLINSYGDNLKILTQWGAVNNIETNRCGIMSANETGQHEYLVDGLHPNEAGALKMARYNSAVISALFT